MIPRDVNSQVIPAEGSQLNYRLVGFSFPPTKKGFTKFDIEISSGTSYTEDSFEAHFIKRIPGNKNRVITELPSFGCAYTWRIVYQASNPAASSSKLYHFSILNNPVADTSLFRLHVTTKAKTYKDAYVFVDANKTLYDMNGNPVWFLPAIEGKNLDPRDLKLTPRGTITFVSDNNAYEISYNGAVLWKAANGLTEEGSPQEYYHHEITRLKNGHYMVLGSEPMLIVRHSLTDTSLHYFKPDKTQPARDPMIYQPLMVVKLLEFDSHGKLVWLWKGSDHFTGSLARLYTNLEEVKCGAELDFHANAFYFDEEKRNVYISLRNINMILKIAYPGGNILNEYAGRKTANSTETGNDLFCSQHCCGLTKNGYLFTFNNNDCDPAGGPKIILMEEPLTGSSGKLKKIWEYSCPIEKNTTDPRMKIKSTSGGNVIELPDGTIFGTMSSLECTSFIVNMEKEILWSATAEKRDNGHNKWAPSDNSYRSSIILSRKDMEHLVWGEEIK